jgi:toxin secretion/phage lysis holin
MLKSIIASGVGGTVSAFLLGDWTVFMSILLTMIGIDIVTGIAKGIYDKKLRSRRMSQGMIRKLMIWVVIIMANFIDIIMFSGMPIAKTSATLFYIGMEMLSVIENLGQMGIKIPRFIGKYVEVIRDKGENPDIPEIPQEKKVDEIKIKVDEKEIKLKTKDNDDDFSI